MRNFLYITGFLFLVLQAAEAQDFSSVVAGAADDTLSEQTIEDVQDVSSESEENNAVEQNYPVVGTTVVDNNAGSEEANDDITIEDDEEASVMDILEGNDYVDDTKVNPNRSLTENLTGNVKKERKKSKKNSDNQSPSQNNWMDKLITANSKKDSSANQKKSLLGEMIEESKSNVGLSRSNAAVFDISGVMLRMSLEQADAAMQKRGYKKISQKLEIPNFIKWRNEELCRGAGVVGYERLGNCVKQKAQKDHYEFVETAKYSKFDTKESMEIHLTSTFTGNKIYKIIYRSESALVRGSSQKAAYLRNIKIYDFWKKINQKYGAPDNRDDVLWGLGGNKPYMHAKTGFLILEDPMLRELDYTRMSREDQRFINTDIYTF